jgi:hypothetical protein
LQPLDITRFFPASFQKNGVFLQPEAQYFWASFIVLGKFSGHLKWGFCTCTMGLPVSGAFEIAEGSFFKNNFAKYFFSCSGVNDV